MGMYVCCTATAVIFGSVLNAVSPQHAYFQ